MHNYYLHLIKICNFFFSTLTEARNKSIKTVNVIVRFFLECMIIAVLTETLEACGNPNEGYWQVWVWEREDLVRVVLAQPPEEVVRQQEDIAAVLSKVSHWCTVIWV